jgi:uncharacterized protein (TIGR02453 family)
MAAFTGFPKQMITFFDTLKENNTKQWFDDHRKDYEAYVKQPAQDFVVDMGIRLEEIAPAINAVPQINGSIFRLNKDIRFSKDKSPYKTHIGIFFWEGNRKRMECPGYYMHIENRKLMLGVGLYMFTDDMLERFRDAVVDAKLGNELSRTATDLSNKGYNVGGKHYKKVPRGYDASNKNAEFLLYNGLHVGIEMDIPDEFYSRAFIDYAFSYFKEMCPLQDWLKKALSK